MKKKAKPYSFFDSYCLRTPLLPFSFYLDFTKNKKIGSEAIINIWKDPIIKEAIFLASTTLHDEIDKYANGKIKDSAKQEKIKLSFLKYLSRMTSRCTPFGIFAGCSIGKLSDTSTIKFGLLKNFSRHTRFDMNFLVALAQKLSQLPEFKKKLLFYSNSSLYKVGKQLRFVEYTYFNNKRVHSIEAVRATKYLESVLKLSEKGKTINELANHLVSTYISKTEARDFIDELINNQLLISELEPSVSGDDFLRQLIQSLQRSTPKHSIIKKLSSLSESLKQLDQHMGNSVDHYLKISQSLKKLETSFDLKYGFQTDLFSKFESNQLSKNYLHVIKKGMKLLNKMTLRDENTNLDRFKKALKNRYGENEIPLSLALDIEMGIGYIQSNEIADNTPILDDLQLPERVKPNNPIKWNKIEDILYKKLIQSISSGDYYIELSEKDFIEFEEDWSDLPTTIATIAEISHVDGKEVIYFDAVGGSSAANLSARFCNGENSIFEQTKNIIAKEEVPHLYKVHAEIIHLPEARTGNILMRPVFREYEIPYLAKSSLPLEKQIPIDDLMISVKKNRVVLRSKKHNKEVIPHLTNAHNYRNNSLPIYHFLCDLQTQGLRGSIYYNWGNMAKNHSFLPRVVYNPKGYNKSIIFSKAKWIVGTEEMIQLKKYDQDVNKLLKEIKVWRNKCNIPQYVQLKESDNTLLINLGNYDSTLMFLDSIKNKKSFMLEEFLFDREGLISSKDGFYTNQFVFSFYKT